jgi:hypothetical protein
MEAAVLGERGPLVDMFQDRHERNKLKGFRMGSATPKVVGTLDVLDLEAPSKNSAD